MAAIPSSLIIHVDNFFTLPVNQRLVSLQKLNFAEFQFDQKEDGATETTDTIVIQKEELRGAMLRGLVSWNTDRHARRESMQHLCELWRDLCRDLRKAMYEYCEKSTSSESHWRYKGPGNLRSLVATLPPPTIPILLPRPPSMLAQLMPSGFPNAQYAPQMAPGWASSGSSAGPSMTPEGPPREPKTSFCFPAYGGAQGACVMIFGTDFDEDTKFLFDWPYAEPSGWSQSVEPEFVTPTGAVVRAPPLYCNAGGRKDVQVYILAEDAEGHTRGDAQYTYLLGRAESGHMWQHLQQCLSEVDDGLGVDDFGADSSSSKTWKDVDGEVKEADSEQGLVQRHFELRHDRGRLLHGLQHVDVHGRTALHYMAALAHKAVLRYCFEKLGKEGDRLLSVQDLWNLTPLHFAVAFERPATVELLLKHSTPQSRDLFRTPTPETKQTLWTLAKGNEDLLFEIDRGMEAASEREYKAIQPPSKKRRKGYQGPDINIDVIDGDGAICLSD